MTAEPATDPRDREIAALRSRVSVLEGELRAQAAGTAALVAEAQEKLYWLERWHVDLDKVMAKPGAIPALDALKRIRGVVRATKRVKRRLRGG